MYEDWWRFGNRAVKNLKCLFYMGHPSHMDCARDLRVEVPGIVHTSGVASSVSHMHSEGDIVFSSVSLWMCGCVCLSLNMITPEPLEIWSQNFQGIILWSKGQTSSKMAYTMNRKFIQGCASDQCLWCSSVDTGITGCKFVFISEYWKYGLIQHRRGLVHRVQRVNPE